MSGGGQPAAAVVAALQCAAPRGQGDWERMAEALLLGQRLQPAGYPAPLPSGATGEQRADARRAWVAHSTDRALQDGRAGLEGVPLDATSRAARAVAAARLATAATAMAEAPQRADIAELEEAAHTASPPSPSPFSRGRQCPTGLLRLDLRAQRAAAEAEAAMMEADIARHHMTATERRAADETEFEAAVCAEEEAREAEEEEAAVEAEVGPEAAAAARRVRLGAPLSGDVWCLLAAGHRSALAWLPADDRDELLLLAALDGDLRRLLDDAGRAQVDELLRGPTGEAVSRARVSIHCGPPPPRPLAAAHRGAHGGPLP